MDVAPTSTVNEIPLSFGDETLVPRKSLVDDARFDVTAMVDLVFMMNIFFLVTWAELARAEIDLPTARHCTPAERSRAVVFTVLRGPVVYLGDSIADKSPLSPGEVDQRVGEAVEKSHREESKDIVLIKAEKEVLLRDVAHIAGVATAGGGVKLMLAVLENR
jgi:biopolymer transport protein ExbD